MAMFHFLGIFSDILELGTYSECYCFVILIIILVSTFLCFTMIRMVCSEFQENQQNLLPGFSDFTENFEQIIILLFLIL